MMSQEDRAMHVSHIYGLRLTSEWALPYGNKTGPQLAEVEFVEAAPGQFADTLRESAVSVDSEDWFQYARLPDGSEYLRWSGLFEFLVSPNGRRIECRSLDGASPEAFHTYLLGQVLSYSLLKLRIESLHSTAVMHDGEVVAFLGDCGYGKSSLGAVFLSAGYSLLTDDLLIVREEGRQFVAYPGSPRIKLFPEIARALLGPQAAGVQMNDSTPKLVIPLDGNGKVHPADTFPLKAIYVLTPPQSKARSRDVVITLLSPRSAFVQLLKYTFNTVVTEQDRLERQFDLATRIAGQVPVKLLSYPRILGRLPRVMEAVCADLAG